MEDSPFLFRDACLCPLGEEELGDFETSHQGRYVQRGSTIAIPCGRDGSVLEKKPDMLEPAVKGSRTQGRPTALGQGIDVGPDSTSRFSSERFPV